MSVPPRDSGWASTLPIFDFRLPIGFYTRRSLTIGNWQLAMLRPTRYRVVVLTSFTTNRAVLRLIELIESLKSLTRLNSFFTSWISTNNVTPRGAVIVKPVFRSVKNEFDPLPVITIEAAVV